MGPGPTELNRADPALHALTDARFLVALVVLVLNDHWWKPSYGNFLTGKLSDVAGLIVLPIVVGTIVRLLGFPPRDRAIAIGAGCWFGLMKTSVTVAAWTEELAGAVTGTSHTIVVDPTDLIGVVGLSVALATLRSPKPLISAKVVRSALLACGLLAVMATGVSGPEFRNDLVVDSATGEIEAVQGLHDDGKQVDGPLESDLVGAGIAELALCDPNDAGTCFAAVEDRIVETTDGKAKTVWSRDPTSPSRGKVRHYYDQRRAEDALVSDMMFNEAGVLHIVSRDGTRATRSPGGEWTPSFAHFRPIALVSTLAAAFTLVAGSAVAMRRRSAALGFLPIAGLVTYLVVVYGERFFGTLAGVAIGSVVCGLLVVLGGRLSRWWLFGIPVIFALTVVLADSAFGPAILLGGLVLGGPILVLKSAMIREARFAVVVILAAAVAACLPFVIWRSFIDVSYVWTFAWLVAPAVAMWVVDQLELD